MRRRDHSDTESPRAGSSFLPALLVMVALTTASFYTVEAGIWEAGASAKVTFLDEEQPWTRTAQETPPRAESRGVAVDTLTTGAVNVRPSPPACDVEVCEDTYRSFNAQDCTFQPYEGPRKRCMR